MPKDLSTNITTEIETEEHRPIELYIITLNDYISYTRPTDFLRKWGSSGTGDGEFNHPRGISVDNDEVYVTDTYNHRVQVFDLDGVFKRKWGTPAVGDGQIVAPEGIFVYNNEVYVVDSYMARIKVFDINGIFKRTWGGSGSGDGNFEAPRGIMVYNDEVYVADSHNFRIQVFDLDGIYQRQWGSSGTGDGEFNMPFGIAVYNDEVYVTDDDNHRIQVFDLVGTFKRKWGSTGAGDGEFNHPRGISVDNDEVYVTDDVGNRIQVFEIDGTYKRQWGSLGVGDGEFEKPIDIDVYNDEVYVPDEDLYRIQVFDESVYTPTYHNQIFYFTDHDQNVDFFDLNGNPKTYNAIAISRSEVKTNIDTHIDSVMVRLDNINRAMTDYITTYRFRGRNMIIWRIYENYLTDSDDYLTIFDGSMDKPAIAEGSMEIVVKSRLGTLAKKVPRRMYQVHCNWEFGGSECTIKKLRVVAMIVDATVTAGSGNNVIVIEGASYEILDVDYYKFGSVIFTAGDNNKETRSITYSKGSLANYGVNGVELGLSYSLTYDPGGDTATIQQGCDKTPTTCKNKYDNLVNYGGFTTVPQLMVRR